VFFYILDVCKPIVGDPTIAYHILQSHNEAL